MRLPVPQRLAPATALSAALTLLALPAAAQPTAASADRQARTWAATCAACHGSDGKAQGAIPAIAGRDAEQIYRTLLEFKNGQRPAATVMHQHAKGYTDDELRRIAQAFATLAAQAGAR
jgi:cytochrome subunit of sulfide dehydrogenase